MNKNKNRKESAESWEQKSWRFAVGSYERSKKILSIIRKHKGDSTQAEFWKKRISDLELKYPSLKK